MAILAAGIYFLLVFAAGFALGTIRTLWLQPRLGTLRAELAEMPLMVIASWAAAKMVLLWMPLNASHSRMIMGGVALLLMVIAEIALVRPLRRMTVREYLRSRGPLIAAFYYVALVVFSVMPLLV